MFYFIYFLISPIPNGSLGDGLCGLRKTESVPPSLGGRLAPELRARTQRLHAKANTINLPTSTIKADDRKKVSANVAANNAAVSPTSPPHANVSTFLNLTIGVTLARMHHS